MNIYRFVGNIPTYLGDVKYSKIGETVKLTEVSYCEIVEGGATFIPDRDFQRIFTVPSDVASFGDSPEHRANAPARFNACIAEAQQLFREIANNQLVTR